MQELLNRINKTQGVRGSLVIGQDGFVVASDVAGREDPNILGALASTVIHAMDGALEKLRRGAFHRLILGGTEGRLVIMAVGTQAYLMTLLTRDATMGMVLVELRDAAKEIEKRLDI